MATLRDEALAYSPPQTLNIADLDKVPVDIQVYVGKGKKKVKDKDGNETEEEFTYKYAKLNDKEYRVPPSVIEGIQTILKLKPEVRFVKVSKTGSGLATKYKVNPSD